MGSAAAAVVKAPEGFTQEGTPEIDGWFKAKKGAVIFGQIVGLINIKNSDGQHRDVALIKLAEPAVGIESGSDKEITFEKGKVLGLGVSAGIQEILLYVEVKALAWLHFTDKKKLPGGRTMWKVDQRYKGKKSATPAKALTRGATGGGDDDDIPF